MISLKRFIFLLLKFDLVKVNAVSYAFWSILSVFKSDSVYVRKLY